MITEKEYPPITLPGFSWVDGKVGTFFSRYNDKLDIDNLLRQLTICRIKKDKLFPIDLRTCWTDVDPLDLVFLSK